MIVTQHSSFSLIWLVPSSKGNEAKLQELIEDSCCSLFSLINLWHVLLFSSFSYRHHRIQLSMPQVEVQTDQPARSLKDIFGKSSVDVSILEGRGSKLFCYSMLIADTYE